jgi:hypothetical protein
VAVVADGHATLGSGRLPTVAGRVAPAGVQRRFQLFIASSFAKLPWRTYRPFQTCSFNHTPTFEKEYEVAGRTRADPSGRASVEAWCLWMMVKREVDRLAVAFEYSRSYWRIG